MQNITQLIDEIPLVKGEQPEDIFADASSILFDEVRNLHGDPAMILVYKSAKYGPIKLRTADPSKENDRRLFAHYLWNAGLLLSERLSGLRLLNDNEISTYSVRGHTVLELGAGVGLSGIIASLSGASEVVITDFPTDLLLDNIRRNIETNAALFSANRPLVQGHEWGEFNNAFSKENKHRFTRILAADCFWLPQVHRELALSMLHFLSLDPSARVFAVGGFHTGRAKLAAFFSTASDLGLETKEIYEEDARGVRRPWLAERDGGRENPSERKNWLTIAILSRKADRP